MKLSKLNPLPQLKTFWYVASKSATSPNYYRDLLQTKLGFSVKYFLALVAVFSSLISIRFAIVQLPQITSELKQNIELAKGMFEDDLVIEISDDNWVINKHEPYSINLEWDNPSNPELKNKQYLIVFDHAGTIDKFDEYNTFVLINGKNIITKDNNGLQIMPISEANIPKGKITKTEFLAWVGQAEQYIKWLPVGGVLFSFVGLMLYFSIIVGINMLLIAVPVWLFSQLMLMKPLNGGENLKKGLGYVDSIKITLHAATLPLTLLTTTKLAGLEQYSNTLSFWTQVAIMLIGIFVVGWLAKNKPESSNGTQDKSDQDTDKAEDSEKPDYIEPDNI